MCLRKNSRSERKLMARKPFHEKIYVFLVFSSWSSFGKNGRMPLINIPLGVFLGLSFSNDFLSFLKSGQLEVGGRGPDLKLVHWRHPLHPVPTSASGATQTSHMCPSDPAPQYGLEKPTQGLCNPSSPILKPSIQPQPSHHSRDHRLKPVSVSFSGKSLSEHLHSIVLTLKANTNFSWI